MEFLRSFLRRHFPGETSGGVEKCPEKNTLKVHVSNTELEKGDHYHIQTRHKDLFAHYNLILRKL